MPFFGSRPETSITVKVNQICQPHFNDELEDDSVELQLADLLPLIKIQPTTGATEVARAIRKNIKYGDQVPVQVRAIRLLEVLVLNGGLSIGSTVVHDDKLNEVLKGVITGRGTAGDGGTYSSRVQRAARELALGWQHELLGIPEFRLMPKLWNYVPGNKPSLSRSRGHNDGFESQENVFDSGDDDLEPALMLPLPLPPPAAPPLRPRLKKPSVDPPKPKKKKRKRGLFRSSRYADDEYKIPQINYKVEAPKIRNTLLDCHTAVTNLTNTLKALPPGELPTENAQATAEFNKCKRIRRKVLRYIQFVGAGDPETKLRENQRMDDEFLGALISANELLVDAFKRYDRMSGIVDTHQYDNMDASSSDESYYTESDSDDDADEAAELTLKAMESMTLRAPPPRPPKPVARQLTSDTVSSDPFGDTHVVNDRY